MTDTEEDDPQVRQLNPQEEKWYPDCKRLTAFILNMVCWQAVCGGLEATASGEISMADFEKIASEYQFVNFGEGDHGEDLKAYQKDGMIVCAFPSDAECPIYCGSNSEEDIHSVADKLGLDMN